MKHKVIKYFKCKESGEVFSLGSLYVSSSYERVKHLEMLGFIVANKDTETLKEKKRTNNTRKKASDKNASKSEEVATDK